ncbi:hypothetical protein KHC28_00515 [Ancylobacter sonchi]|uniref:hypothetical protein n=1 Tax=Ancylobacter sonchi TaxID=1937790 RepID=UPI001BD1C003|nr:hypothetical protein [Ancylobacter sonchi]MBS7532148.1 hypothetical protein [Ancylobacter sonchi]
MEPYALVNRRFAKDGDKWIMAPENPPGGLRTWSGWSAFIPQPWEAVKKKGDTVKIGFRADYIAVEGGTVVAAGYNDLEKIVLVLRG